MADGRVVIEAILDTVNVTKNIKNLSKDLKGISWKDITKGTDESKKLGDSFKAAGTACTAKLTAPVAAAGAAAFKTASDYGSATSRIQAALGATRKEAERFKDIGATIYEGGWGESMDDVTDALIQTKSTIRDIDDQGLQTVTQNALVLADTFDADVNESIRGTNALMEGFGLTAEEASDLLAAGMQNGLNYTDELADNLAEYSVRWGQAGVSASEYFSLLEAGASNGAYNLDKVGDFLNEFLTSLSDGRLEENMGKFSSGTKNVFKEFKAGKKTAKDVLDAVIGDMKNMTDETDRAALAGSLWSSLGEDNAMGMILAMGGVEDKYADVTGAANEMAEAAGDNFASKMQSAGRTVLGALEPLGEPLANIASKVADLIRGFGEWFASIPQGAQLAVGGFAVLVAAFGPMLTVAGNLITVAPKINAAFTAIKTGATGAGTGIGILNKALSVLSGPIGIVIAVVGALVAAFMWAYDNVEPFRTAIDNLVTVFTENFGPILEQVGTFLAEVLAVALQAMADFIITYVVPAIELLAAWINEYVVPALQSFWSFVEENILPILQAIGDFIMNTVVPALSDFWSWFSKNILPVLQQVWSFISTYILPIFSGVAGIILGTVVPALRNLWNWFSANILPILSDAWNAVKTGIDRFSEFASNVGKFISDAKKTVEDGLKAIKGFFDGLKLKLPEFKLPHFKITGQLSLNPPQVPHLDVKWYATGAIFNRPTIAGIGEAGPEGVIPLSGSAMRPFARTIAEEMPQGKDGASVVNNYYSFGDITIKASDLDDADTIDKVVKVLLQAKRAHG